MSLVESTLFGEVDKVQIAIDRLRQFEPKKEGYFLAFSGGKDSVTLYRLAQMAGVKFDAHYNITTVDPPELVQFIKREYPEVARVHPERSMWQLMLDNKWPPQRMIRYCCKELKENSGHGRVILTGVRWAESAKRKRRRMTEACFKDGSKLYVHPIIDWANDEVWQFIHAANVPYCSLYDEGFERLGCILCPMSGNPKRDIQRWPKVAAQYLRIFERIVELRKAEGLRADDICGSGQRLFDWWISRKRKARSAAQMVMFE